MTEPDLTGLGVDDIRRLARKAVSADVWDHIGAAESGATLRRNQTSFRRYVFRQRIFHEILTPDLSTELFGRTLALPYAVAPIGSWAKAHADGPRLIAQAASLTGAAMVPSHASGIAPADWASWTTAPLIFMAYLSFGHDDVERNVRAAEESGFLAVGLTMDGMLAAKHGHHIAGTGPFAGVGRKSISSLTKDVEWLKRTTRLPVLVKGIMHPRDAELAVQAGADGVVVSNHGGRQMDYGQAPFEVLPEVVAAVGSRVPVIMDSGIRSGGDVVKALAFGARLVLIGRPIYWGVAAAGGAGVTRVFDLFHEEVVRTLVMTGTPSVRAVTQEILARAD